MGGNEMILENYTSIHPAIAIEVKGSDLRRAIWWDELNSDPYITIETPDDGTQSECQSYLVNDNGFVLVDYRWYLLILIPSIFSTGKHICYIVNA
jgi:hypothetical protein